MNFVIQSTLKSSKAMSWTIGISTVLFTALFHESFIGLNLSLFALALTLYWFATHRERFRDWQVSSIAFATLITIAANAWYGTADSVIWTILSLMLLSQQIYYPQSTLLLSETKAAVNLFLSPLMSVKTSSEYAEPEVSVKSKIFRVFIFLILPLAFGILFASIYSTLNPIFEEAYHSIIPNLDFSLILTISLGVFASICLLRPCIPEKLIRLDQNLTDNFNKTEAFLTDTDQLERQVGVVLFSLLNITLLIFLITDISFVQEIASGRADSYSQYVHQGVGLLIFSIVIASSFILFFFRGAATSLLPNLDWLKLLALIWIVLNIGILITTAAKNSYYVSEYSLTLKRVGVFIYLSLAAAGLLITLAKIAFGKTNAFIFRNLYWSFFLILTVNICLDWSSYIARYNLSHHIRTSEVLDWQYLLSLDERTLPIIAAEKDRIRFSHKSKEEAFERRLYDSVQKLQDYQPGWREISFARLQAKSKIVIQ